MKAYEPTFEILENEGYPKGGRMITADELRKEFSGGHPKFVELSLKEMELHGRKNSDYAKGGNPLGNFNRVADILRLYPGLDLARPVIVALVYMLKQLDAALYMLSKGYEGKVENVDTRLTDVHVYAKLARILFSEEAPSAQAIPEPTPEKPTELPDFDALKRKYLEDIKRDPWRAPNPWRKASHPLIEMKGVPNCS